MLQFDIVQTLVDLGLTVLQAKVYIALAKSGTSTGRAIAKDAKVASQDVYRLLSELHDKGLIEKIIGKPNKFIAIPLEAGFSILIERRKKQTSELEKAAVEISKSLRVNLKKEGSGEMGDFILIPEGEPTEIRGARIFETAQNSVDLLGNFQDCMFRHERAFETELKLINKGIRIRNILSRSSNENRLPGFFLILLKSSPKFQVRYIDFPVPASLLIKDRKEVLISTMAEPNTLTQPYLWSNNNILVQIIQQWYDIMWEKSSEEKSSGLIPIPKIVNEQPKVWLESTEI